MGDLTFQHLLIETLCEIRSKAATHQRLVFFSPRFLSEIAVGIHSYGSELDRNDSDGLFFEVCSGCLDGRHIFPCSVWGGGSAC